jgi:ferredoxin-NADP reductase
MTIGILALVIFAAILAQLVLIAGVGLYRRRRQFRAMGRTESVPAPRERLSPAATERAVPISAWKGFREFEVQRRVFEDEMRSICSFYLMPVDDEPLPAFRPGQFLTFRLSIEDPVTHVPREVVRCYSLSDRPSPDYYRVSIKRIPPPADQPEAPPGLSSTYFHDHVVAGSRLWVKAPSGYFHLMEDEPLPVVLIAGGIGITPMLSMLNTMLECGMRREVWLYYGVRNGTEHIMKSHLQALAKAHRNFNLHVCYSAPGEGDEEHVDYWHRGRVDIDLLRSTLKLMRYQFYVCGPRSMMESLVPGLEEWGVSTDDIFYESFGPATLVRHAKDEVEAAGAEPKFVTFSHSGKSVCWDPAAGSLLAFAETNGIEITSGCRAGSCGTCQTALLSGEVEYSQRPDADVETGHCLLCITTPKGDLTLHA